MNIIAKEKVDKGWSSDLKYCITDDQNNRYLLRISSIDQYQKKLIEFNYMKEVANLGLNICKPIEFGTCEEGVYSIQTWVDGVDAEEYIPTLTLDEQYLYGLTAGNELKKIHSIEAPIDTPNWEYKFNNKVDRKIKMYEECPIKYEKGSVFLEFIRENRYLLKNRPNKYQHGDFHIGNMMINSRKELVIIDFNRNDFGDPWEEFNRIVWSAQVSPMFAKGMVDGYFNGEVPDEFWKLLALYICSNTLSSLPWAIPYGVEEIQTMVNQANEILRWYDDMKTYIPSWYKK